MAKQKASSFFEGAALELGVAIQKGDLSAIQQICDREDGIDLNTIHKKDMTFLHFALIQQNEDVLKLLVQKGASPHIEIEDVGSVMGIAVRAKDPKFLKALFDAGVDANSTDRWEMPQFFKAATKDDDSKTLALFARHGADFDIPSSTGRTAVMQAFTSLCYDQVDYLIRHGVDLEKQTNNGVTLAYLLELELRQQQVDKSTAAYKKLVEIYGLMKQRGVKFPPTPPEVLRARN